MNILTEIYVHSRKRRNKILLIFIFFTLQHNFLRAQGNWQWAHGNTDINNTTYFGESSMDKFNNNYVVGMYQIQGMFDTIPFSSGDTMNYFALKIDSAGNVIWIKSFPYDNALYINITAKPNGGCFLTGGYNDSIHFGTITLHATDYQAFFVSLDANGDVEWAFNAEGGSEGISVACDKMGQPVFTGSFSADTIEIAGVQFINTNIMTNNPAYIIKLDTAGNALWSKTINGDIQLRSRKIAINDYNEVFFACRIFSTAYFDSDSVAGPCEVLAKYDSIGTLQWVKNIVNGGWSEVRSITTDLNGNVYCVGSSEDQIAVFQSISIPLFGSNGDFESFIAAYDSTGNVIWANLHYSSNDVYLDDVTFSANGLIYFCGKFRGDTLLISNSGMNLIRLPDNFDQGYYGVCNISGNIISLEYFEGNINSSINVDGMNNIYLCGEASDSVSLGSFQFASGSLIAKHSDLFLNDQLTFKSHSLNVWPNPCNGTFLISNNFTETASLNIYTITGEKMLSKIIQPSTNTIILDDVLSAGFYILEVNNKSDRYTGKILVY